MGTVTLGVTTGSSSNTSSYAAVAFTPLAGDLLVVLVNATGTVATANGNGGSITDTQNLGWTKLVGSGYNTNADTYAAFVANNPAANSTETITWACTGDAATGALITAYRISGAGGFPGVRQVGFASGAAAATPTTVKDCEPLAMNALAVVTLI